MKRFILSTLCAATLLGATAVASRADVSFSVRLGGRHGGSSIFFRDEPRTVLIPRTDVYYVTDVSGGDVYRYGGYWYCNREGYWYRARSYRGPWLEVSYDYLPEEIISIPAVYPTRYHHYPFRVGARYSRYSQPYYERNYQRPYYQRTYERSYYQRPSYQQRTYEQRTYERPYYQQRTYSNERTYQNRNVYSPQVRYQQRTYVRQPENGNVRVRGEFRGGGQQRAVFRGGEMNRGNNNPGRHRGWENANGRGRGDRNDNQNENGNGNGHGRGRHGD